ncbi:MAG: zinc-dependent alcohol dehydrogenase family protein [Nisaea sp.]|uniref:zinc-dependent alcohol dehydrogenase family protein n=1 Tax=Nisaea sp. TaxID=2024842 RepID=UPI001B0DA57B|nr:zinc-dependent alcohol dehydrogenase family protein [Nisaea sp.]MBO6562155.1 zinc-dependent alcohol dehydrogenase family protein [Nisaea sp.]
MEINGPCEALSAVERPQPEPGPGDVLVRVHACAVCRTDLHVVDGDLPDPKPHVVPGHEVVGTVEALGSGVTELSEGTRVGVPWLGWTCGECRYCLEGQENLCPEARFTGYTLDGGYGEYLVADARYCFPIPEFYSDAEAAPLLCAGLIGYRCLRMAGEGRRLGLYGFGAAAHILIQVALWQGREIYGFVRPGDKAAKDFARSLGAVWAGDSDELPPEELDAAILFAPVGDLVPLALRAIRPGGTVVCGGIHMSDIPGFPYDILWREKKIVSVANLTRRDAEEFLELAPKVPVRTTVQTYPLDDANRALSDLREGRLQGAAVLVP